MNRLFSLFLLIIIFSFRLQAQTSTLFGENYPDSKSCVGIDGNYFISSNAVTVKFQNSYLNNKFIDTSLKDASLNKMKDVNRLGSAYNAGLYYRHKTNKFLGIDSAAYFISIKDRSFFNSKFPADLFHLYFYGNKPFEGKTADVNNFNYRGMQWQQLQFGILKEIKKGNSVLSYAASISLLNGQYDLEIKTTKGSLYTQTDAEYVDMNLQLESKQSDTAHTSFGSNNGLGASADLELNYSVKDQYHLRFTVADLGFIAWNSKSFLFNVDTNYHFEGVIVNNLFDSLYLDLKSEKDFKEDFKKDQQSKSFTTTLPFCFNLSYERTLIADKLTAGIGAKYVLNSDYKPLGYIMGNYFFNSKTQAGITLQYGGFGGFHAGVQVNKDFGKGFIVSAGSAFLDGYVAASSSTGQGAFLSLKKIF